jgi:hypothetical protein
MEAQPYASTDVAPSRAQSTAHSSIWRLQLTSRPQSQFVGLCSPLALSAPLSTIRGAPLPEDSFSPRTIRLHLPVVDLFMSAIWRFRVPNCPYRSPFVDDDLSCTDDPPHQCNEEFRPLYFTPLEMNLQRMKVCRPEVDPICWLDYIGSDGDECWSTRSLRRFGISLGESLAEGRDCEAKPKQAEENDEEGQDNCEDSGSEKWVGSSWCFLSTVSSAIEKYHRKRHEVLYLDKSLSLNNACKPPPSSDDSWKTEICKNWSSEGRCKYVGASPSHHSILSQVCLTKVFCAGKRLSFCSW